MSCVWEKYFVFYAKLLLKFHCQIHYDVSQSFVQTQLLLINKDQVRLNFAGSYDRDEL